MSNNYDRKSKSRQYKGTSGVISLHASTKTLYKTTGTNKPNLAVPSVKHACTGLSRVELRGLGLLDKNNNPVK